MKPNAPMDKHNRRFAWSASLVSIAGLTSLALASEISRESLPFPIALGLMLLSGLAMLVAVLVCFDDLSNREFRDPNTKMRWTAAFFLFGPALPIYLLYFGFVLVRRERSIHTYGHRTNTK